MSRSLYCTLFCRVGCSTFNSDLALLDIHQVCIAACNVLISAAESVAVRSNGDLALLDKYGNLYEAVASSSSSSGSWQLQQQPLARLGAGRPLGYHFDADGDLVICDSLKVGLYDMLLHSCCAAAVRSETLFSYIGRRHAAGTFPARKSTHVYLTRGLTVAF
jgi:hypothetical protein